MKATLETNKSLSVTVNHLLVVCPNHSHENGYDNSYTTLHTLMTILLLQIATLNEFYY